MERAQQLRILWTSRWWLLAFAVAAALAAYFVSASRSDVYRAAALDQIISSRQAAGEVLSEDELLSLANVFVELASTQTALDEAHKDPSVSGHEGEFDDSVSVDPQARVGVLSFKAENGDPETAADWANAYANGFAAFTDKLQSQQRNRALDRIQERIDEISADIEKRGVEPSSPSVAGLNAELQALQDRAADETAAPGDTARVIERAVPPADPASPKPLRDAILVFIGALVLGAIAAYVREALVDRYSSPEEAATELGLPILGEIPKAAPDVPMVEAFRRLRTAVVVALEQNGSGQEGGRGVLVTGAEPGSGKSFVTTHLARALAAEGWRVVVVDGDLRRPTVHGLLDVPREPGLGDLLAGGDVSRRADDVVRPAGLPTGADGRGELRVLPAGTYIENSVERLSSSRMAEIVRQLRAAGDFILFDSPPVLAVVDPVVLARHSDGVAIVIDSRKTKRRDARRAAQTIRAIGTPILGLVYNRSHSFVGGGYYSYDAPAELRETPGEVGRATP
jgi:capsular exopolysaccharide synthesis family protein